MGTGGEEKGLARLIIGKYNAISSWRDDVYDGTGDVGIKFNALLR